MKISDEHIRGAILEEVVLYLLARSGYVPLNGPGTDSLVRIRRSSLELRGRGAWHQMDSIADFRITPPFGNPIRLLAEAKFLTAKVGLPIIRNASGVLKDVSENWVVEPGVKDLPARQRFHYLSAVFSASEFTKPAQHYAYAQDVYLVPLARSTFMRPAIEAIGLVAVDQFGGRAKIADVRGYLRRQLFNAEYQPGRTGQWAEMPDSVEAVVAACQALRYGAIAMFGGRFPAFLVAAPDLDPGEVPERVTVRIRWLEGSWFIEDLQGHRIFSFDLPDELFRLYAKAGVLTRRNVAEIKGQVMSDFFAFLVRENNVLRIMQFQLDEDWYGQVRERVRL